MHEKQSLKPWYSIVFAFFWRAFSFSKSTIQKLRKSSSSILLTVPMSSSLSIKTILADVASNLHSDSKKLETALGKLDNLVNEADCASLKLFCSDGLLESMFSVANDSEVLAPSKHLALSVVLVFYENKNTRTWTTGKVVQDPNLQCELQSLAGGITTLGTYECQLVALDVVHVHFSALKKHGHDGKSQQSSILNSLAPDLANVIKTNGNAEALSQALRLSNHKDPESKVHFIDIDNVEISLLLPDSVTVHSTHTVLLPPDTDQPFVIIDSEGISVETAIVEGDIEEFEPNFKVQYKHMIMGQNRTIFFNNQNTGDSEVKFRVKLCYLEGAVDIGLPTAWKVKENNENNLDTRFIAIGLTIAPGNELDAKSWTSESIATFDEQNSSAKAILDKTSIASLGSVSILQAATAKLKTAHIAQSASKKIVEKSSNHEATIFTATTTNSTTTTIKGSKKDNELSTTKSSSDYLSPCDEDSNRTAKTSTATVLQKPKQAETSQLSQINQDIVLCPVGDPLSQNVDDQVETKAKINSQRSSFEFSSDEDEGTCDKPKRNMNNKDSGSTTISRKKTPVSLDTTAQMNKMLKNKHNKKGGQEQTETLKSNLPHSHPKTKAKTKKRQQSIDDETERNGSQESLLTASQTVKQLKGKKSFEFDECSDEELAPPPKNSQMHAKTNKRQQPLSSPMGDKLKVADKKITNKNSPQINEKRIAHGKIQQEKKNEVLRKGQAPNSGLLRKQALEKLSKKTCSVLRLILEEVGINCSKSAKKAKLMDQLLDSGHYDLRHDKWPDQEKDWNYGVDQSNDDHSSASSVESIDPYPQDHIDSNSNNSNKHNNDEEVFAVTDIDDGVEGQSCLLVVTAPKHQPSRFGKDMVEHAHDEFTSPPIKDKKKITPDINPRAKVCKGMLDKHYKSMKEPKEPEVIVKNKKSNKKVSSNQTSASDSPTEMKESLPLRKASTKAPASTPMIPKSTDFNSDSNNINKYVTPQQQNKTRAIVTDDTQSVTEKRKIKIGSCVSDDNEDNKACQEAVSSSDNDDQDLSSISSSIDDCKHGKTKTKHYEEEELVLQKKPKIMKENINPEFTSAFTNKKSIIPAGMKGVLKKQMTITPKINTSDVPKTIVVDVASSKPKRVSLDFLQASARTSSSEDDQEDCSDDSDELESPVKNGGTNWPSYSAIPSITSVDYSDDDSSNMSEDDEDESVVDDTYLVLMNSMMKIQEDKELRQKKKMISQSREAGSTLVKQTLQGWQEHTQCQRQIRLDEVKTQIIEEQALYDEISQHMQQLFIEWNGAIELHKAAQDERDSKFKAICTMIETSTAAGAKEDDKLRKKLRVTGVNLLDEFKARKKKGVSKKQKSRISTANALKLQFA